MSVKTVLIQHWDQHLHLLFLWVLNLKSFLSGPPFTSCGQIHKLYKLHQISRELTLQTLHKLELGLLKKSNTLMCVITVINNARLTGQNPLFLVCKTHLAFYLCFLTIKCDIFCILNQYLTCTHNWWIRCGHQPIENYLKTHTHTHLLLEC